MGSPYAPARTHTRAPPPPSVRPSGPGLGRGPVGLGLFDQAILFGEKIFDWFNISEPILDRTEPRLIVPNGKNILNSPTEFFFPAKIIFPPKLTVVSYALFGCVFSKIHCALFGCVCSGQTPTSYKYQHCIHFISRNSYLSLTLCISVRVLYIIVVRRILEFEVQPLQNRKSVLSWETIVHQPCAPRGSKFVLRKQFTGLGFCLKFNHIVSAIQ